MDLVLRGGTVVDGTGSPAFKADVAVRGDTVAAVGDLANVHAARVIDVTGLVVAPGFIDMHSHSDFTFSFDATADSKVRQGVTTEVVGQCGLSVAPIVAERPEGIDFILADIARVSRVQLTPRWLSFGEYLADLERGGLLVNVVPLVGHGTVRAGVMGLSQAAPTDDELEAMKSLVATSMREGAWGLSTGLVYAPGLYAETAEIVALARVVADHGGFYFTHIRGEGEGLPLLPALEEAIHIGMAANVPVQVCHFKQAGRASWPLASQALALIEQAQADGLDIMADLYPYQAAALTLPRTLWPHLRPDVLAALFAQPLEPGVREELRGAAEEQMAARGTRWDECYIANSPSRPEYEGLTIEELAEQRGAKPVDAAIDALVEARGWIVLSGMLMSEDNVRLALCHPATVIGSDAEARKISGPLGATKLHPRAYGTFPRILGHYVRTLNLLTLEQAVHKMTGLAAERLGLRNRGRVAVGRKADIAVFDPETVIDTATYAEPRRYPPGIEYVLVNGEVVVEGGEVAERFPGKVLRR